MNSPAFIISLDFELHWGRFDKVRLTEEQRHYRRTKEAVYRVLALFAKGEIAATWATVGMLMADDFEEWEANKPSLTPSYQKQQFSAYEWAKGHKSKTESLFAPDLVRAIIQTPRQELGSHTFAHYYTMEAGQQQEEFRADLKACQRLAEEKFALKLHSLVFPRNQYDNPYLKIAAEAGFTAVRTNPGDWYWRHPHKENLIKKIFRTGDTLYPLGQKSSFHPADMGREKDMPLAIPASRLLRPFRPASFFNQRRIERIKMEMTLAARLGEYYHLWWHPHNFGHCPEENLLALKEILDHYQYLHQEYGMLSRNMEQICAAFEATHIQNPTPR
ncbi:polysaccharide deacetylase family protein [Pararhodonellum marinum]|uniref:polysaccharide deacetylase family protein n=1 Tax=Pararhodonellum marinum TaxID=2755358 RepID=UPI00188FD08F|nr:polysaccharide deacetylase family protein [Pararhodonellum marinum]